MLTWGRVLDPPLQIQEQRQLRPPEGGRYKINGNVKIKNDVKFNREEPARRRRYQSQMRPSRKGGMAATRRTGTAGSQDESRCGAIHKFNGYVKFNCKA